VALMEDLCFALAKRRVLARAIGSVGANPATFDPKAYQDWRSRELVNQYTRHFSTADLAGKDVLDFGCGEGDLSFFVATLPVASVTGVDVEAARIESANARLAQLRLQVAPRFCCAKDTQAIDLPDQSIDLILCFDVLEHVMSYQTIVPEWRRVLRPRGRVFIWWVPWFHPYGPHIESLVPLPWAHVLWSDRTLIKTCARIYDMPQFKPRSWDLDDSGQKKPNKWRTLDRLPGVNKLTIRHFERLCPEAGLTIEERKITGFGGGLLAKLTHPLTRTPMLREFFAACVTYKLIRQ
jgi:SAM-dependent methyltransferase